MSEEMKKIPLRSEVAVEDTWNLSDLYHICRHCVHLFFGKKTIEPQYNPFPFKNSTYYRRGIFPWIFGLSRNSKNTAEGFRYTA